MIKDRFSKRKLTHSAIVWAVYLNPLLLMCLTYFTVLGKRFELIILGLLVQWGLLRCYQYVPKREAFIGKGLLIWVLLIIIPVVYSMTFYLFAGISANDFPIAMTFVSADIRFVYWRLDYDYLEAYYPLDPYLGFIIMLARSALAFVCLASLIHLAVNQLESLKARMAKTSIKFLTHSVFFVPLLMTLILTYRHEIQYQNWWSDVYIVSFEAFVFLALCLVFTLLHLLIKQIYSKSKLLAKISMVLLAQLFILSLLYVSLPFGLQVRSLMFALDVWSVMGGVAICSLLYLFMAWIFSSLKLFFIKNREHDTSRDRVLIDRNNGLCLDPKNRQQI